MMNDQEYLNADKNEINLSQVLCLLGELNGETINPSHWRGYHPEAYNKYDGLRYAALLSELRGKLKADDVSTRSLELQMWWRDHLAECEVVKQKLRTELGLK